jgi:hypothetical protein
MTGYVPSQNPRGRRRAVAVALFAITAGLIAYRGSRQPRAERDWIAKVHEEHSIVIGVGIRTGFRFIDQFPRIAALFGKRHATVALQDDDDGEHLLSLPDCPMPVHIFATRSVSEEMAERLRDRYGAENVQ